MRKSDFRKILKSASDELVGEACDIARDTQGLMYVLTTKCGIHKFAPGDTYKYVNSFGSPNVGQQLLANMKL